MRAAPLALLLAVLGGVADAAAPARVVRFLAFGDAGTGTPQQYGSAQAMAGVCAERGCDFALMLGDNIYPSGVASARDPQFEEKFEKPFAVLELPVYAVLGNHDNGGDGRGNENARGNYQVEYGLRADRASRKWRMPARYYRVQAPLDGAADAAPLAEFFMLDSNPLSAYRADPDPAWDAQRYGAAQLAWLRQWLPASKARWKIALAHHPYISNGPHGNAGRDEIPREGGAPFGSAWKAFVEAGICASGTLDLFLAGHDHNLAWLKPPADCGKTQFVISGSAAKPTGIARANAPAYWQAGDVPGFFWFELTDERLRGAAYVLDPPRDADGRLQPAFEQALP